MFYAGKFDAPHVMLTFVGEDGRETPASVAKNCEQSDLTHLYCMISGVYTNMFTYNGVMIEPGQTVESLGMQDGDIVRVGGFPTFSFSGGLETPYADRVTRHFLFLQKIKAPLFSFCFFV